MKLVIKAIDGDGPLALHTEDGEVLPNQSSLIIKSEPNCIDVVMVEFLLIEGGDLIIDYGASNASAT